MLGDEQGSPQRGSSSAVRVQPVTATSTSCSRKYATSASTVGAQLVVVHTSVRRPDPRNRANERRAPLLRPTRAEQVVGLLRDHAGRAGRPRPPARHDAEEPPHLEDARGRPVRPRTGPSSGPTRPRRLPAPAPPRRKRAGPRCIGSRPSLTGSSTPPAQAESRQARVRSELGCRRCATGGRRRRGAAQAASSRRRRRPPPPGTAARARPPAKPASRTPKPHGPTITRSGASASTSAQVVEREGVPATPKTSSPPASPIIGQRVPGTERGVDPLCEEDTPLRSAEHRAGCELERVAGHLRCQLITPLGDAEAAGASRRPSRPPRPACADRATRPPPRPGTPRRGRRSRPRRPHTGPASRSRRAPVLDSDRRRPCTATGRREPTLERRRRSPRSTCSRGRSSPR